MNNQQDEEQSNIHISANSGDLLWNYTTTDEIRSVDISSQGNFITASSSSPDSSIYLIKLVLQ